MMMPQKPVLITSKSPQVGDVQTGLKSSNMPEAGDVLPVAVQNGARTVIQARAQVTAVNGGEYSVEIVQVFE